MTQGREHGYGIIQQSSILSDGAVTLPVTTIYASLERLEGEGLVTSNGDEVVEGRLRRYFVLTPAGETRLSADADRLEVKVRTARSQLSKRNVATLGATA